MLVCSMVNGLSEICSGRIFGGTKPDEKFFSCLSSSATAKQCAHMFLLFHPTHCWSHMYLPVLVFVLVTICGEGDESLETHYVLPSDPGALSTFISLNSRDALDHSDCSSPSESVLLMNMYGMHNFFSRFIDIS